MKYENIVKGQFLSRPNRFIATVSIDELVNKVHVKNTGRCKELLVEGADVYLEDFNGRMGTRKLRYSLIAVRKGNKLINMDSQAPNKVVKEALMSGTIVLPDMAELKLVKSEKTYYDSRFDFYVEDILGKRAFIEVKGVTLEDNGVAKFPDAPTTRGVKHVLGLAEARRNGYLAYVLFVIQMKGVGSFMPNDATHLEFGDTLRFAQTKGVKVLAYDCKVENDCLEIDKEVIVCL